MASSLVSHEPSEPDLYTKLQLQMGRSSSDSSWCSSGDNRDVLNLDRLRDAARGRGVPRGLVVDGGARRPRKRQSHESPDSGLSDTSSGKERRGPRTQTSLRAFRAQCERTLRSQQAQITKVAELCERALTRPDTDSSSTTDIIKSGDCQTYKIIMRKLDELQRLYASRPRRDHHGDKRERGVGSDVCLYQHTQASVPVPVPPASPTIQMMQFDLDDPVKYEINFKQLYAQAKLLSPRRDAGTSGRPRVSWWRRWLVSWWRLRAGGAALCQLCCSPEPSDTPF